jgi:DNA-binding beta-propeller fold protein YncE
VRSLDVGPVAVTGAATGSATGSQGGGGAGGSAGSSGGANGFPQGGGQRAGGQAFAAQFGRQLLASGDGKTLYLVDNSASGSVMEIDATMFKVQRNQAFVLPNAAPAPQLSPTAGATPGARSRSGASGFGGRGRLALREAMLSPDGATLWLPGSGGLAAINTSDLQLRGLYLPDVGVESIAFSPDGARLYALSAEQGKIIRLDAQTGTRQGEIGYVDQPYALLHVLTNR